VEAHKHAAVRQVALRDVLLDVLGEDFVDKGLIPNTASTSLSSELLQYDWIEPDRDQVAWFVSHWRTADATHRFQLLWRRIRDLREINLPRSTRRARCGSRGAR
jgi:hypothetical protein